MNTSRPAPAKSRQPRFRFGLAVLLVGLAAALATFGAQRPAFSQAGNVVPEAVRHSKAWQRAMWHYEQRAYPGVDIPAGAQLRAAREIEAYRAPSRPDAALPAGRASVRRRWTTARKTPSSTRLRSAGGSAPWQ